MKIPPNIQELLHRLEDANFRAYVVGGAVRDIILGIKPTDWDITTNAHPEEIQTIFPDSVYENTFGTVLVKIAGTNKDDKEITTVVEITTFRKDATYSDGRHPDKVEFSSQILDDLSRRDFTINAMAMDKGGEVVDPHNGQDALQRKVICAVGDPRQRFAEDGLRMVRAIRFVAALGFRIEEKTFQAIQENTPLLSRVAHERIGEEMFKMFQGRYSYRGIELMRRVGILHKLLPEVAKGIGVSQNKHHIYDVYEHNLYSLKWADEQGYSPVIKIAALLHDVAKPQTKKGQGKHSTFYGHDIVGGRMSRKIVQRMRWSKKIEDKVALLIHHHMFYYNVGEVTEKSIRRLVAKVGVENMDDLVKLRICDRMGSGVPKPEPYRLRHFQFLVEKVQKDPLSVGMLKVDGRDIMEHLSIQPSPKVGHILAILFEDVLDEPSHNTKEYLLQKAKEVSSLTEKELIVLRKKATEREQSENKAEEEKMKKKYFVE